MLAALQKTTIDNTAGAVNAIQPHPSTLPNQEAWLESITALLQKQAQDGHTSYPLQCLNMCKQCGLYSKSFVRASTRLPVDKNWLEQVNNVMCGMNDPSRALKSAKERFVLFADALMQDLATLWRRHSDVPVAVKSRSHNKSHDSISWHLEFDWSSSRQLESPVQVRLARDHWERRQKKARTAYLAYQQALLQHTADTPSPLKKAKI